MKTYLPSHFQSAFHYRVSVKATIRDAERRDNSFAAGPGLKRPLLGAAARKSALDPEAHPGRLKCVTLDGGDRAVDLRLKRGLAMLVGTTRASGAFLGECPKVYKLLSRRTWNADGLLATPYGA